MTELHFLEFKLHTSHCKSVFWWISKILSENVLIFCFCLMLKLNCELIIWSGFQYHCVAPLFINEKFTAIALRFSTVLHHSVQESLLTNRSRRIIASYVLIDFLDSLFSNRWFEWDSKTLRSMSPLFNEFHRSTKNRIHIWQSITLSVQNIEPTKENNNSKKNCFDYKLTPTDYTQSQTFVT